MEVTFKFNPDAYDENDYPSPDARKLKIHMQAEEVMDFLSDVIAAMRTMVKEDHLPSQIDYSHTRLYYDYRDPNQYKVLAKFMQQLAELGCPRNIRKVVFKEVKKKYLPPRRAYTPKTPVHKLPGDVAIDLFRDAFFELAREHNIIPEID